MKVKIKRLNKLSTIPCYASEGDAGMDLTCTGIDYTQNYISYKTGLAFEIPEGYFGMLVPRSSICNKDLILSNSCGILDSKYRGEVELRFKRYSDKHPFLTEEYSIGDRIGQIIILPYPKIEFEEVDNLEETTRGNGFGSSGN